MRWIERIWEVPMKAVITFLFVGMFSLSTPWERSIIPCEETSDSGETVSCTLEE